MVYQNLETTLTEALAQAETLGVYALYPNRMIASREMRVPKEDEDLYPAGWVKEEDDNYVKLSIPESVDISLLGVVSANAEEISDLLKHRSTVRRGILDGKR